MACSMLLSDDQREPIRDIHLNLSFAWDRTIELLPEWRYFCNVFASPWDRRSILPLFPTDSPNDKAEVSFYYSYSPSDISMSDPDTALAASSVTPLVAST